MTAITTIYEEKGIAEGKGFTAILGENTQSCVLPHKESLRSGVSFKIGNGNETVRVLNQYRILITTIKPYTIKTFRLKERLAKKIMIRSWEVLE